MTTDLNMLLIV